MTDTEAFLIWHGMSRWERFWARWWQKRGDTVTNVMTHAVWRIYESKYP